MKIIQLFLIVFLTACSSLPQKSSDEGRPYEFGFTIDGQQHRHEKKDDKGIVQGEFGFITADGIYHVTVYATDENGRFKILSMRNLRISAPLDGSPFKGEISPEANKYRKQANLPPLPPVANPLSLADDVPQQAITTSKSVESTKFTLQPTIKPACASCGYITTTKKPLPVAPIETSVYQNQQNPQQQQQQPFNGIGGFSDNQPPLQSQVNRGEPTVNQGGFGPQPGQADVSNIEGPPNVPSQYTQHDTPISSGVSQISNLQSVQAPGTIPHQYQPTSGPQTTNYNTGVQANQNVPYQNTLLGDNNPSPLNTQSSPSIGNTAGNPNAGNTEGNQLFNNNGLAGDNQNTQITDGNQQDILTPGFPQPNPLQIPGEGPGSDISTLPPIAVENGVIHVGGDRKQDIPIKDKFPGMQDGLPQGVEEKDITDLLYKFHYTVGFHGHYEKGLKNGAKIGGYFVNGRDGISRVVTYIADENGYRPKVKFINIGLDSDDTPKPETEKTFGLKSFEFVWYPI